MRVKAYHAPVAGIIGPFVVDVGMPLPLGGEGISVELVAFLRGTGRICSAYIGLAVSQHGFAASVIVFIRAYYGPSVYPLHRLQMYHPSVGAYILKVHEPVLAGRSIHPSALMRPVDRGVALCKHGAAFVRAVNVLGAKHHLPAGCYSSGREEYVVIAVFLVEFRTFACLVGFVAVENDT